jgi:Mn2+/Fe2+ NRAMP family transporter
VTADTAAQTERPAKWKVVGPGLVVAATGVGAADLVATMVAGSTYGYTLMWVGSYASFEKVMIAWSASCS